jgi:hypothetical protein
LRLLALLADVLNVALAWAFWAAAVLPDALLLLLSVARGGGHFTRVPQLFILVPAAGHESNACLFGPGGWV